jgi:hypothetical protein
VHPHGCEKNNFNFNLKKIRVLADALTCPRRRTHVSAQTHSRVRADATSIYIDGKNKKSIFPRPRSRSHGSMRMRPAFVPAGPASAQTQPASTQTEEIKNKKSLFLFPRRRSHGSVRTRPASALAGPASVRTWRFIPEVTL